MSRALMFLLLAVASGFAGDEQAVSRKLESRVDEYLDLRKKATQDLPPLKPKVEPEQIQAHKNALAKAIVQMRSGARQGDILDSEIAAYLRTLVTAEMTGASGKPARETAKQGNPAAGESPQPVTVRVNAVYPDSAPASTVPATLLLRFPKLPKSVDFRFVGRDLVLRDVDAGLILDFVSNVVP